MYSGSMGTTEDTGVMSFSRELAVYTQWEFLQALITVDIS